MFFKGCCWSNLSNAQDDVSPPFQTLRRGLEIRRVTECFLVIFEVFRNLAKHHASRVFHISSQSKLTLRRKRINKKNKWNGLAFDNSTGTKGILHGRTEIQIFSSRILFVFLLRRVNQSLVLRSIVVGCILIHRNWSIWRVWETFYRGACLKEPRRGLRMRFFKIFSLNFSLQFFVCNPCWYSPSFSDYPCSFMAGLLLFSLWCFSV